MDSSKNKQSKKSGFERKEINGKVNPKYVDLLDEDKPLAGQKFVCMSFCSPEKILKEKEIFFFEEFLKNWDFNKSMEKFLQFINTRGLKVRGVYPTQEEAELRCKMLREIDPNHDIMVGPVGMWMPWDPEAYKTGRVEYMEEELNQIMHEKQKNESNAKSAFEQRVKETKQQAIEENIKNAEKSGNTLSQTIDEKGNLIGVNNSSTQEFSLGEQENISTADICKELFEGENIVVGKTDNGQSLLKSGPFAGKK